MSALAIKYSHSFGTRCVITTDTFEDWLVSRLCIYNIPCMSYGIIFIALYMQ